MTRGRRHPGAVRCALGTSGGIALALPSPVSDFSASLEMTVREPQWVFAESLSGRGGNRVRGAVQVPLIALVGVDEQAFCDRGQPGPGPP